VADILHEVLDHATALLRGDHAGMPQVMRQTLAFGDQLLPDPRWERLAALDWEGDVEQSRAWLEGLLSHDAPGQEIDGLWFGLFDPIYEGAATWDFYVSGSTMWGTGEPAWPCDTTWWVDGRYRRSTVQHQMRLLSASQASERGAGDEVFTACDVAIRLVHVAGTVLDLLGSVPASRWLGPRDVRGVSLGHDSGDFHDVAVLSRANNRLLDFALG
jgi:hypothetical protein